MSLRRNAFRSAYGVPSFPSLPTAAVTRQLMSVPYVSVPDLLRKRENAESPRRDDATYVEINEYARIGESVLSVLPKEGVILPRNQIMLKPTNRYRTNFSQHAGLDFRHLSVQLNYKQNPNNQVIFESEAPNDDTYRNRLNTLAHAGNFLNKLVENARNENYMFLRIFDSERVPNVEIFLQRLQAIDDFLARDVAPPHQFIYALGHLERLRADTYGQLITGLIVVGKQNNRNYRGRSLRLMINFLDRVSHSDDDLMTLLLGSFYTWATLDGCDSCMEKIVFDGSNMNYPFSLSTFAAGGEGRAISIEQGPKLRYIILDHDAQPSYEPVGMRKLEHSFIRASSLRDVIPFRVALGNSTSTIELPLHQAMSLLKVLDGIHRGFKTSILGKGSSGLRDWGREELIFHDDFQPLKQMLTDILYIYRFHPVMRLITTNVFSIAASAVVPDSLLREAQGHRGDFYGPMINTLCTTHCAFLDEIFSQLLPVLHDVTLTEMTLDCEWFRTARIMYLPTTPQ